MRRALAQTFTRLATTLMVVSAMLSGGGVAKMAHLWTAHAHGGPCVGVSCSGNSQAVCTVDANEPERGEPSRPEHSDERRPSHDHGDCATCAELAVLTPTLPLESPFTTVLAVLSLVHDSEAAQISDPTAPDVCAARPPPARA